MAERAASTGRRPEAILVGRTLRKKFLLAFLMGVFPPYPRSPAVLRNQAAIGY